MLNPCLRQSISVVRALSLVAPLTLAGCAGDDLSDESTGFVDLITANPTLSRNTFPTRGWTSGNRVDYIDFGSVTVPRKFGTRGETLRIPDVARVFPIYFFFDSGGAPLFSKPAFEARSAAWHMRGGKDVLDPTPVATPLDGPANAAYFANPYVLRPRAALIDPARSSADYQRPVIDAIPGEANYAGLWEIVEITVNESDYSPDDVKSGETVRSGISSGQLTENRTGKVINCPVVDDRTQVHSSAMANDIPRPRIEIWFRTKLGSCYLVNGWETIGETLDESRSATDVSNLRLFRAGVDQSKRVDTFDVNRLDVDGVISISVPIAKAYTPTLTVAGTTKVRYPGDDLTLALPRHKESDPPGYSPIVWQHDLNVPQDPPYQPGAYKDFTNVDPSAVVAREADTTVLTRNLATVGPATPCVSNADCRFGQQCNPMPDPILASTDPPPGMNLADVVIARENGPRCDVPAASFGGYCAAGVTRCDVQTPAGSVNETRLKALGVASAGPTFTIHADLKAAEQRLTDARSLAGGVDPALPMRQVTAAEQMTAQTSIAGLEDSANQVRARVAYYDARGFTMDFGGFGYGCWPQTSSGAGFCMIRCDSAASATATAIKTQLQVPDGITPGKVNEVEYTFNTEARCGGVNMLGYKCLPASVLPERQRFCLRECISQDPLNQAKAICEFPLNLKADQGMPSTAFSLGDGLPAMTQVLGQACTGTSISAPGFNATTVQACTFNPDFEPRNPALWPGPVAGAL